MIISVDLQLIESPLGCLLMVFIHSGILMSTNRSWVSLANGLWRARLKCGLIKALLGGDAAEGCKWLYTLYTICLSCGVCVCVCWRIEDGWVHWELLNHFLVKHFPLVKNLIFSIASAKSLSENLPCCHPFDLSTLTQFLKEIFERLLLDSEHRLLFPAHHTYTVFHTYTQKQTALIKSNFKTC